MKWFSTYPKPKDDIELAENAIDYLRKSGTRPERYKVVSKLYKLISNEKLPDIMLMKIADLGIPYLDMRIATKANKSVLQFIIDMKPNDQNLLANILYNSNLTKQQAEEIVPLCDDSTRGFSNRRVLADLWDIQVGYRIGDIVEFTVDINKNSGVEYRITAEDLFEVIDNPNDRVDVRRLDDDLEIPAVPLEFIRPAKAANVAAYRKKVSAKHADNS